MIPARAALRAVSIVALAGLALACSSVAPPAPGRGDARLRELEVTATAYNSVPSQTQGEPTLTAWGDRLRPGMKAIAVSRDLIPMGLGHGAEVEIEGLPGVWVVRDKMAKRWRRKIDVYMGNDVGAARQWGRRTLVIRWSAPE